MDKKALAELNIQATYNLAYNASLMVREGLGSCIMLEKIINVPPYDPALCFRLLDGVGGYPVHRMETIPIILQRDPAIHPSLEGRGRKNKPAIKPHFSMFLIK